MNLLTKSKWAMYGANPILFFTREMKMKMPPKLREFVLWFVNEATRNKPIRAIVCGPRGGGKSKVLAGLEFWLWRFLDWDITNLGGSKSQADTVFAFLANLINSPDVQWLVGKTIQSETVKAPEAGKGWIRVLAASQTQVRSPHAGDETRGGALIQDEVCEMDDELAVAAHPIVNTANPSAIIESSTFHKAFGEFQERWDAGEWKRFSWDCFDVSQKCEYACEGERWKAEGGTCPVLDFCKGRAHTSEGWMLIDEIIQSWRDHDREWFEIEMMGMRPSVGGLVYAPELVRLAFGGAAPDSPGTSPAIGHDWGFSGESFMVQVSVRDGLVWVDKAEFWNQTSDTIMIERVSSLAKTTSASVLADSSHPFQNDTLSKLCDDFRPVVFSKEKATGVGYVKHLFEKKLLRIPDASPGHRRLYNQLRNYMKDAATGKPEKKHDHGPDALMCACLHLMAEGIAQEVVKEQKEYPPGTIRFRGMIIHNPDDEDDDEDDD